MIAPAPRSTALPMETMEQTKLFKSGCEPSPEDSMNLHLKEGGERHFPQRLYEMLEKASLESFDDVVSWEPNGMSFVVRKPLKFASEIMPR